TYRPENNITRAEVCKMICVALNGGKEPTLSVPATPTFKDVRNDANSAWAEKYIESCVAQGIVGGVGNGMFQPSQNVTGSQLAKMLLVALGYKADIAGFGGNGWDTKVNVVASAKGLYEGLETIDTSAALTRDSAAQMLWNALNAYEVEYKTVLTTDANGQLTTEVTVQDKVVGSNNDKITLMEDKYESKTTIGVLTKYEWNESDKTFDYTIGEDADAPVFQSDDDFSELFGMNVKVVYTVDNKTKDTKVYGIVPKDSAVIATGILDDVEYYDSTYIKVDGTKYKTDEDATGAKAVQAIAQNQYNTKNSVFVTTGDDKGNLNTTELGTYAPTYSMRAIDNDNDGKIDTIVYLPVYAGEVTSKGTKQISVKYFGTTTANTFKFEDDNIYEDVAKDDYVLVTENKYTAYDENTIVKMDSVSGKVTATRDGKVQIDGKWYTDYSGENFRLDGTYTFYVAGSFVFYAEQKGSASLTDVLYVDTAAANNFGDMQAKVYFYDGTSATIDVDDVYDADGETAYTGDLDDTLFTFSKDGSAYDLTVVNKMDSGAENLLGYDIDDVTGISKPTDNVSGKFNDTYAIADDAVVFIKYVDGGNEKVKVVSGAVAKNYKDAITGTGTMLYDTVNGTKTVIVANIVMTTDLPNAKGVSGNYGYVVDKPFKSKIDGDTVIGYTIWDGKEAVTVYDKASSVATSVAKGSLVTFDNLGDGMIDNVSVAKNGTNALTPAAVKGIDGKTFTIYGSETDGTDGKVYIITDDTTVLYVDSEDVAGAESGSLQTAGTDTSGAINNINFVIDEADGGSTTVFKLDLLVIEINNEWK
ncbi:MAG: S-layer homology domain-containing protein, partial [Clostridiales bacterium]|nr:S-layer homology domain-containing protein [Clostridiales bacterium]